MLGKKSGGELVLKKETFSFGTAFVFRRRALCTSKSSWHWPLLCGGRALANLCHFSPFGKLLAAYPRVVELQEGGRHPHVTQVPPYWSPLWHPQPHPASSPCVVLFLLHVFLLLLLDSPSSGDDEDDDDESEDTGNLFLQDTESFFKQRYGCRVAWFRHLPPPVLKWMSSGQEHKLLGPGTRNLEITARVV